MSRPDAAGTGRRGTARASAPTSGPDETDRDELFDLFNGYWLTQMLCTAAELGVPDVLAEGPYDISTLARRTGADADAPSRLLRALVAFGVVARTTDGHHTTTRRGRWLERARSGGL